VFKLHVQVVYKAMPLVVVTLVMSQMDIQMFLMVV
jgi:hypothetical protein